MSKYTEEPKPAWVAPPDPERVGHARKDRRRWCRGREGREHVLGEPELSHWGEQHMARTGHDVACFRPDWYVHYWICQHVIKCIVCGRVMRRGLNNECPIYTTEITRWKLTEVEKIQRATKRDTRT